MSGPEIRAVGGRGVLLQFPNNDAVHAAARLARERYGDQLEDVVPGHETLLLVWRDGRVELSRADLASFAIQTGAPTAGELLSIPVVYDGVDLESVAAKLDVSREAVVMLHTTVEYVVAFLGFAPGFPYLVADAAPLSEDASRLLQLPRLETPRTQVPAGSVAVAAGYCGIYPRNSPGGWNLLGETSAVLFDSEREPPALLEPGGRVRFEAV